MRKIVQILFIVLLGVRGYSQQTLNITYDVPSAQSGPILIMATDSGYICSVTPAITYYLIDFSGNVKWVKSTYMGPAYAKNTEKLPGGEFISTCLVQYGGTIEHAYLIKLDQSLDTLFTCLLLSDSTSNSGVYSNYIFRNSDNRYVIIGQTGKDSSGVLYNPYQSQGLLILTDTLGNINNLKTPGPISNSDWFNTGLQMGNHYYLFGATRSYAPAYVTNPFDRTDGWVVKTDMEGNELASAAFGNPEINDLGFDFAYLTGNRLITGGFMGTYKNMYGFAMGYASIIVLDDELNLLQDLKFQYSSVIGDTLLSSGFNDATVCSDSSITMLGINSSFKMTSFQVLSKKSTITNLDKNYNVRFFRTYTHQGNVFNNITSSIITSTSDGGYIFGGYVVDNTLTPSQQSWLVKTDSLGCDGFTSCNDTALVTEILHTGDTLCKNDTAFIHIRLKGRSAPYFVRANGILALDSVYYPYNLPLWIDTLMPFYPTDTGWQQLIVNVSDPWGWNQSDTIQVYVKNCGTSWASEDYYRNKVEVFPNPATTNIHIRLHGAGGSEYVVTVYDMQGKLVLQQASSTPETLINMEAFEPGIYTVKVLGDKVYRVVKICLNPRN